MASSRRGLLIGGSAVAVAAVVAAWMLGPWRSATDGPGASSAAPAASPAPTTPSVLGDTAAAIPTPTGTPPSTPTSASTTPGAARGGNGGDNAGAGAAASGAPTSTHPAKPPRLELVTSDSAELRVDGRLVARGRWSGVVPTGTRVPVRASIGDPSRCRTARRDTVLKPFAAGDVRRVQLDVRACVGVRYDVEPRDARVAFRLLDNVRGASATPTEIRADSMQGFELPLGRYEVRTSARGCVTITDTMQVASTTGGGPVTRRLRMICS